MKYLLLGVAAGLGFGIALSQWITAPWWLLFGGAALVALSLWRRAPALLWAGALVLGLLTGGSRIPGEDTRRLPLLREITGRVESAPELHASTISFVIRPQGSESRVLVYLPQGIIPPEELAPGTIVRLTGEGDIAQPRGWQEYLNRRGIAGVFWGRSGEVVIPSRSRAACYLVALRYRLLDKLSAAPPEEGAALLAALLLGEGAPPGGI